MQKTNPKEFIIEEVIKRKGNKLYVKWKGCNNSFNSWIDKKDLIKISQYIPPYRNHGGDIKVELDLSNYSTKTDLKIVTHVDISSFASNTNLVSLKIEVDKLDTDKLKVAPTDLSKLSNVVKNDVVKKTEYDKFVGKVHNIDTKNFVLKNKYEKKMAQILDQIPDVSGLVKKTDYSSKIAELENKIPNVSGFLLTSVFNSKITEIENKIPDIKNLASKTKLTAYD